MGEVASDGSPQGIAPLPPLPCRVVLTASGPEEERSADPVPKFARPVGVARPAEDLGDEEPADLQSRLEQPGEVGPQPGAPRPEADDPVGLLRHLEATRHFHRDSGLGRIFHPASVSFRENRRTDSLHLVVNGNHVAGHVDRVSPLGIRPERASRYSLRRALAHNAASAAHEVVAVLRGRQGDLRTELDFEWVWDPARAEPDKDELLDPVAAAWSVQLEARVAGCIDEARLRRALGGVLGRRPIARELLDVVECGDDEELGAARAELASTPVGVGEWPPLRARLAHHPGGDVVMLNLNHAAADGAGALRVLQALGRAYAGRGEPGPLPDFLAVSDLPVRASAGRGSPLAARWRGGMERLRNLAARPARLAADQASDEDGYGFHHLALSAADTEAVVSDERPGTSRNVLLAGLHLAIGEWNLDHGTPGRQVGVLVPVDLRPAGWPGEIIANLSVTARISTSRRHRGSPATVLRAITAQTTRNKRTRTGTALWAGLERCGLLALWAKQSLVVLRPLTRNRHLDTSMLANLGTVEPPGFGAEAGETTEVWYSVPARTPECLCVGAVRVGGRLHLSFRYPRRLFGPDAARRFAECYLAQIRSVAERRW